MLKMKWLVAAIGVTSSAVSHDQTSGPTTATQTAAHRSLSGRMSVGV